MKVAMKAEVIEIDPLIIDIFDQAVFHFTPHDRIHGHRPSVAVADVAPDDLDILDRRCGWTLAV